MRKWTSNKKASTNTRPPDCCKHCGRLGYASIPVFLRVETCSSVVVCFKTYCVFCGHIPSYVVEKKNASRKIVPAVYAPGYWGLVRTEPREFFLPNGLYETFSGKLDIAKKTELCRAFLRLVLDNPNRHEFSEAEMFEEWERG